MAAPATVNSPSLSIMVGVGGGEVTWKIEEEDKLFCKNLHSMAHFREEVFRNKKFSVYKYECYYT